VRTIVDLPKEHIEALDTYAKSKGISRAAAVREAVATYIPTKKKKKDLDYWRNYPSFGSEKRPKGFNSVEYVRKLRAEWNRRSE
jgi:Ribbon-helix-helix protein, copG family